MATALVHQHAPEPDSYILSPVMNLQLAKQRLQEFQAFVKDYLVEGEDYGRIPGAPKPVLLKPGADKLCELYGLADDYKFIVRVEDFDKGLFDYTIKCILTDRRRGCLVATGLGNCNSLEQKYRWRDAKRLCPQCGKDAIIKGKEEYGGGWLCFAKKGGCGAKFSDTDSAIVNQTVGRIANEDIADQKNTVLKMAKKRAKIDATLSATRSSGIFTQDLEDMPPPQDAPPQSEPPQKTTATAPQTAAKPAAAKQEPAKQAAAKQTAEKAGQQHQMDIEEQRVKWLETITPLTPDEFYEGIIPLLKDSGPALSFVRCLNPSLLSVVCNRLPTAQTFSDVLVPLQRIAFDDGHKDLIKAIAAEAKKRGYKVNRTNGTYEEPSKTDGPTVEEYDQRYEERQRAR